MTGRLDVITRDGLKNTRQGWQFFDRLHERSGGLLVMIQGGWSFADASAGSHSLAMCEDYRKWNLTDAMVADLVKFGRDLMGTMWVRLEEDGFDPHIHNNLIGDAPAADIAVRQVASYREGRNGLANNAYDRNPYRPTLITDYKYIKEDDMFTEADRNILKRLDAARVNERTRDQAERERDKERFSAVITMMGQQADSLTTLINQTSDDATRKDLKRMKERILKYLKDHPDVDGPDNPSDDAMAEGNMG